ncbi:hypothetical protein P691DRAFT_764984 [Macrolepiota fuliginosa MF-IS2]|uniref:Uncharacterized protein n=1 Tax=Macrolepiota fuliginosa MF-IS2 TaxID=1400762 RepID=A0A9P6BX50_9AGAR|nr:hypothetical protein P691DRAFT_764984 [Macrolepiota fuliginosa MF-IS2]
MFFGTPQLPPTTISPVILNNILQPAPPAVISKEDCLFFEYLHHANVGEKAAVDDFTCHILRMLNFDDNNKLIATKRELTFTMCGIRVQAMADIVILDGSQYSFIVQGDKHTPVIDEPRPQLIAAAIAAFVENKGCHIFSLPQQTFLAIIMTGPSSLSLS